jgi:hypothetical protein
MYNVENMYNVVFEYSTKQFLGLWNSTTSTDAYVLGVYPSGDTIDFLKKNISRRSPVQDTTTFMKKVRSSNDLEIYPDNYAGGYLGRQYDIHDKSARASERLLTAGQNVYYKNIEGVIGSRIISSANTTRLTFTTTIGDDIVDACAKYGGKLPMWTYANLSHDCTQIYSYPISSYRGAHVYSSRQVCFFFEKSNKALDEVRVVIPQNRHREIIMAMQNKFQKATGDIYFSEKSLKLPYKILIRNIYSPVLVENLTDWIEADGF